MCLNKGRKSGTVDIVDSAERHLRPVVAARRIRDDEIVSISSIQPKGAVGSDRNDRVDRIDRDNPVGLVEESNPFGNGLRVGGRAARALARAMRCGRPTPRRHRNASGGNLLACCLGNNLNNWEKQSPTLRYSSLPVAEATLRLRSLRVSALNPVRL